MCRCARDPDARRVQKYAMSGPFPSCQSCGAWRDRQFRPVLDVVDAADKLDWVGVLGGCTDLFVYADNQKPLRRLAAVLKRHDLALIVQIRSTGWIHGTLSTPDYRMQIPGDDMIRRFVNAINAGWLPSRLTPNKLTTNLKQREFRGRQYEAWI